MVFKSQEVKQIRNEMKIPGGIDFRYENNDAIQISNFFFELKARKFFFLKILETENFKI